MDTNDTSRRLLKIILHWKPTKRTPRFFKLLGIYRTESHARYVVEVAAKKVCTLVVVMALAGFFILTTGAYIHFSRNPSNQIGYTDLVFPWKWGGLRSKAGLTYLKTGLAAMEAGKWMPAYLSLRRGLNHYPNHPEARCRLAELSFMFNRQDLAYPLLEEGLKYGYPGDEYVKYMFKAGIAGENYEFLLRMSELVEPMAEKEGGSDIMPLVWKSRLEGLLGLGRYEDALAFIQPFNRRYNPPFTNEEGEALALFKLNRRAEAIEVLEKAIIREKVPPPYLLRMLARLYVIEGNTFGMMTTLDRLLTTSGFQPEHVLFAIAQWYSLQNSGQVAKAVNGFEVLFGYDQDAVFALASLAETFDDEPMIRRCMDTLAGRGLPTVSVRLVLARQFLKHGRAADCLAEIDGISTPEAELPPGDAFHLKLLRSFATALRNTQELPPSVVRDFFVDTRLPLQAYMNANSLAYKIGGPAASLAILQVAHKEFPFSENIDRLERDTRAELDALTATASTRAVVTAQQVDDRDATLARIDSLRSAQSWDDLASLLNQVYRVRPVWLSEHDNRLGLLRIEAVLRANDLDMARPLVSLHHASASDAGQGLLELGGQLRADGLAAAADLIDSIVTARLETQAMEHSEEAVAFDMPPDRGTAMERMQAMVAARQWAEAARFFQQLVRARPVWFDPGAREWTELRLQVALGTGDENQILALVSISLAGNPDNASRLLTLGKAAYDNGRIEAARILVKEVVRRFPDLEGEASWAAQQ